MGQRLVKIVKQLDETPETDSEENGNPLSMDDLKATIHWMRQRHYSP